MSQSNIVTHLVLCIMVLLLSGSAYGDVAEPDPSEFILDVEDDDDLFVIILPDLEPPEEPISSVDPLIIEIDGDDGTNATSNDPIDFGGDHGDIVVEVETIPLPPTLGMLLASVGMLILYTRRTRAS